MLTSIIIYLSRKHGYCFATDEYLSNLLNKTPESIRKLLSRLESGSVLKISGKRTRERKIESLLVSTDKTSEPKDKTSEPKDKTSEPKDKTSEPKDKTSEPKDKTSEPKDKTSEAILINNKKNNSTSPEDEGDNDKVEMYGKKYPLSQVEAFRLFWKHYPKKKEKNDAFDKFMQLKLYKEIDHLVMATKAYAHENHGKDLKYIKLPKTFMGKNRWKEQEITTTVTGSEKFCQNEGAGSGQKEIPFIRFITKIGQVKNQIGGFDATNRAVILEDPSKFGQNEGEDFFTPAEIEIIKRLGGMEEAMHLSIDNNFEHIVHPLWKEVHRA